MFYVWILMSTLTLTDTATFNDAANLHTNLTSNYNKYVRPKMNQDEATDVSIWMSLKSITSLDEVNGILTIICAIQVKWKDDNLYWESGAYGGITNIKIEEDFIWIPKFVIFNPAKKVRKLGLPSLETIVSSNGYVVYGFVDIIRTSCDVDVTYFPWDTQDCSVELMPHGYAKSEINLTSNAMLIDIFSENNVWNLKSTSSKTEYFGNAPYAKLTLSLERRYPFFILNFYTPVLILAVLNAMVFVLPADSGERVGYAITCLLSLSVYMTFASENLPTSSEPIAVISYVLLSYTCVSTLICLGTISGLALHHRKKGHPPMVLVKLCCKASVCRKKYTNEETHETENVDRKAMGRETTTWSDVVHVFDKVCFVGSIMAISLISILYLLFVQRLI